GRVHHLNHVVDVVANRTDSCDRTGKHVQLGDPAPQVKWDDRANVNKLQTWVRAMMPKVKMERIGNSSVIEDPNREKPECKRKIKISSNFRVFGCCGDCVIRHRPQSSGIRPRVSGSLP